MTDEETFNCDECDREWPECDIHMTRTGRSLCHECYEKIGGSPMNVRERIEAEIARQQEEGALGRFASFALSKAEVHLQTAAFLRAILADLPAETPPTLEEFRQSEEWFLVKDGMHIDLAMYDRHNKAGDCCVLLDAMYTERPEPGAHASIARMPRFYPVEGE